MNTPIVYMQNRSRIRKKTLKNNCKNEIDRYLVQLSPFLTSQLHELIPHKTREDGKFVKMMATVEYRPR